MSKDTKKEKSEKNTKKEQKSNFTKNLKVELKKVTWPTRKELVSSTATVLFITILIAVIVFVLDFAFEKANTYGIQKLKSVVTTSENSESNPEVVETPVEEETNSTENNANEADSENQEQATDVENKSAEAQPDTTEGVEENTAQ